MTRHRWRLRRLAFMIGLALPGAGCGMDDGARPPLIVDGGGDLTYAEDIAPILSAGCSCHQPGGAEYARIRLDTYQRVYVLRDRVQLRAGTLGTMPPTGPLPQAQRQAIIAWVDAGSPP